jgi:hypothetical protein
VHEENIDLFAWCLETANITSQTFLDLSEIIRGLHQDLGKTFPKIISTTTGSQSLHLGTEVQGQYRLPLALRLPVTRVCRVPFRSTIESTGDRPTTSITAVTLTAVHDLYSQRDLHVKNSLNFSLSSTEALPVALDLDKKTSYIKALHTMTQPANQSSSDDRNQPPETLLKGDEDTATSRPDSPLSGGSDNGAEKPVREKLKKASIAGLSAQAKSEEGRPTEPGPESSDGEEGKNGEDTMLTDTTSSSRGRPTRKRSFDDLQNESLTSIDAATHDDRTIGHHKRMRSRDMSSSKAAAMNGRLEREQVEILAEENDIEAQTSPGGAGVMVEAPTAEDGAVLSGEQSPKKKRSRDQFDKDHSTEETALEENATVQPEDQAGKVEDEVTRTVSNDDKGEPEKKRHRDASQEGTESAVPEEKPAVVCTSI